MAILGIDEVGRGPWAGPLVVGAVILPEPYPWWVEELNDSKQLSESRRRYLNEFIVNEAVATGLGWVQAYEIDEIGLAAALRKAARLAVQEIYDKGYASEISQIIIDGIQNFLSGTAYDRNTTVIKKGDALIKQVSAASILAKVAHDEYMVGLPEEFAPYDFRSNKGYGAPKHIEALKTFGPSVEHRLSLKPIRKYLGLVAEDEEERSIALKERRKNTTKIGQCAEAAVAMYLKKMGHNMVERNYKTKICEIDLISTMDQCIYFTEVKYRKSGRFGSGLEAITPMKKRQMTFAAKVFLANRPYYRENFQPLLAVAAVSPKTDLTETEAKEISPADLEVDDFFPLFE